ncbi:thioredoxin family protein [Rhizobium sp. L1K21]|uniref:DUF1223 domain-containing protein n=1 Tax=Rhizobium sp. L1K21 TaxID=2954933 RepID=UPI002092C7A5|nr:DUF1223 domain-containing protein [Rhizobium sp. L1K21]MCO6187070.1 DUF1223 domain-containing protein [Rhizobium sp. L1K21]
MKSALLAMVAALVAAGLPSGAMAGDVRPKAVVELFTSQGCYSCPPADAALEKLAQEDDVLALAFHVDYWNYLGWADTLSSHENTERQYGYAATLRRSNVYTPQAVVNGRIETVGSRLSEIKTQTSALAANGEGLSVPVTADMKDGKISIAVGPGNGNADIVVAYFKRRQDVRIERGENAGKTISYWNSVVKLSTVGMWDGQATTVKLPMSVLEGKDYDGCAILLQTYNERGEPGAILGATSIVYEDS